MKCQNGHENPEDASLCQEWVPASNRLRSRPRRLYGGCRPSKSGAGTLWTNLKPTVRGGVITALEAIVLAIGISASAGGSSSSSPTTTRAIRRHDIGEARKLAG
jgi:hypothetical protein